jgi:hypothetical protein
MIRVEDGYTVPACSGLADWLLHSHVILPRSRALK